MDVTDRLLLTIEKNSLDVTSLLYFFMYFKFIYCACVCVRAHMLLQQCVEVRRQLVVVSSSFWGSWKLNAVITLGSRYHLLSHFAN